MKKEDIRNLQVVVIDDARPGMKLGSPVYNRNGLKMLDAGAEMKDADQIERLREQGVRKILVDIGGGAAELPEQRAMPLVGPPVEQTPAEFVTELKEELVVARRVYEAAGKVIEDLMTDVRMGKNINSQAIIDTSRDLVASVLRNPNALLGLASLKRLDEYTFTHSVNVASISVAVARHLNLEPYLIELIGVGALMHDVGKARIPMNIINKPGGLTPEEFEPVKRHPVMGVAICLAEQFQDSLVLAIVQHHHEAYAGSGYPEGLDNTRISKYASIVSIADYYDALTTVRSYKKKISPPEAVSIINATANIKFDRRLVFHFIKVLGIYPVGSIVKLASGRIAMVVGFFAEDLLNPLLKVLVNDNQTVNRDKEVLALKDMEDNIVELNTDFRFMSKIEDII